jgi:diaminohydroxyphosphoribosylaminopyrimidine deaminase/5-amino-6-(5-phosphoribosylamino)uracil reductase
MSNHHSQQLVHRWRTEESAILVGYKTALHDDPQLNARLWQGNQPLRIIFDRSLQLPQSLKMYNDGSPVWVINELRNDEVDAIRFIKSDFSENIIQQLLAVLYKANILSLMVEGGAGLLQSFIDEGLWDEARVFETTNLLNEGLQAPLLHHAQQHFTTPIFSDGLHFYTQQNPLYPYQQGMSL